MLIAKSIDKKDEMTSPGFNVFSEKYDDSIRVSSKLICIFTKIGLLGVLQYLELSKEGQERSVFHQEQSSM